MNKKRGLIVLVVLVSLMTFVNAAWIIFYEGEIITNIIGEGAPYIITQEFSNSLSLNTSSGNGTVTTSMKIEGLSENINMSFDIDTRRTNLNSSCPNYDDDCVVRLTHIYGGVRNILSNTTNVNDDGNVLLLAPNENFIEYMIYCVEDSCPQRINSNVTLEEIK